MKKNHAVGPRVSEPRLRFTPIDRGSVKSQIYEHVKHALMRGEFEPGQVVTIDSLAQAFGTSHMPVREALGRLVTANALVALPNRSVAVPMISSKVLRDIMQVRAQMEGLAGRLSAENLDDAGMADILTHHRRMDAAIEAEDVQSYLGAHQAFHFAVYAGSGSTVLPTLIETLWLQSGPYINMLATHASFQPDGSEHDAILRALTARDPDDAAAAIEKGIVGAMAAMEALLLERTKRALHASAEALAETA